MKETIKLFTVAILFLLSLTPGRAQTARGKASYYSDALHGRRMSNGERYNRDSMVCAHKTYPLGTLLKVTNVSNNLSVVVKVADRGPYGHGRMIDLSKAAARKIGLLGSGVALVMVQRYEEETKPPYMEKERPEIEYEMAGVAYDFMPGWEDVPEATQGKIKKVQRKTRPHHTAAKAQQRSQSSEPTHAGNAHAKKAAPANTQKTQNPAQHNTQKETQKKRSSSSWRNFFKKLRDWGENIFD